MAFGGACTCGTLDVGSCRHILNENDVSLRLSMGNNRRYTPPSESFRTKLSSSGNITRAMFWSPYLFFVWADYLDILQYLTTIY